MPPAEPELCPYCGNAIRDTDEPFLTEDGWAHVECLSDEDMIEALERMEDLGG